MEDAIDLAQTQLFPQMFAARAHEKRRFWMFLDLLMTELPVAQQGGCRTWVQWQLARFVELGLPNGQQAAS